MVEGNPTMPCLRRALWRALPLSMLVLSIAPLASPSVRADDPYEITLKGKAFSPDQLKVHAGKTFFIKIKNENDAPAEFESKDLKTEKIVTGHSDILARVKALKPGTYVFFDDYHADETRGIITAE